jgi:hypothetical protein
MVVRGGLAGDALDDDWYLSSPVGDPTLLNTFKTRYLMTDQRVQLIPQ